MKHLPILCTLLLAFAHQSDARPNILFIMVDDLRPELGCYGKRHVISPNIDRLATRGLVFERAYCQEAACMSSRFSLLSGCRPDTARIWTNQDVRKQLADKVFLPRHFKEHGYHSVGMGKIAHNGWEDEACWSDPHWLPANYPYEYRTRAGRALVETMQREAAAAGNPDPFRNVPEKIRRGLPFESLDVADNALGDGQLADQAIAILNRIGDAPFFLALGFLRPHLPFVAPRKYWDLYDPAALPLPTTSTPPDGAPALATNGLRELREQYQQVPSKGPVPRDLARRLMHGYCACVSYVDAQIGRVLDELDRLEMTDRTIVVLASDHGFHLGELGIWGKATNFEAATRSTLIIRAPRMKARGSTKSLVEFVGIYPTMCDLAGLPHPDHLEGTSFAPLLDQPGLDLFQAALSQYPRGQHMGRSVRTDRYRFTEWAQQENGEVVASELYDHHDDPDETKNLAQRPQHARLIGDLARQLRQHARLSR